jgi:hypothetical protein
MNIFVPTMRRFVMITGAIVTLAGCAAEPQQSANATSFDGHPMPAIGQTKQQVRSTWGNPDRTRENSDGTSAALWVPDKWKFAAPFYGMTARVHALVVKFGPDDRVTSWQLNDQNMFSAEASLQ